MVLVKSGQLLTYNEIYKKSEIMKRKSIEHLLKIFKKFENIKKDPFKCHHTQFLQQKKF